nr:PREDICTED: uncharacterized protein LOC105662679 isoform X2 [Megachile rotundata]
MYSHYEWEYEHRRGPRIRDDGKKRQMNEENSSNAGCEIFESDQKIHGKSTRLGISGWTSWLSQAVSLA